MTTNRYQKHKRKPGAWRIVAFTFGIAAAGCGVENAVVEHVEINHEPIAGTILSPILVETDPITENYTREATSFLLLHDRHPENATSYILNDTDIEAPFVEAREPRSNVVFSLDEGPTYEELVALALEVEYEAQRRLEMLSAQYELSEEQEDLIFPVLARASSSYHEGLSIDGEAATSIYLEEAGSDIDLSQPGDTIDEIESNIEPILTDEQLDQLDEEQVDRYFWWAGVLADLSADIDAEAEEAASEETPPEEESEGEPEEEDDPHQGGNLFDLF